MLNDIKRLFSIAGKGRTFLFLLLLRCPFNAVSTVSQAVFMRQAFNAVEQNDSSRLAAACLLFGAVSVCLFVYNGTVWSIYAPFTVRLESRLRKSLFDKISALPFSSIESVSQGDWLTRLNTDVQMPFSQPLHLPHAACAAVNIVVSAVILWRMDAFIFGWVMLFVIPHIAVSQLLISRAMPRLKKRSLESAAANTNDLSSLIICADTAVLYDAQEYLLSRFERSSLELLRANMKMRLRNALGNAILPLFGIGGYLTLMLVSIDNIALGKITFGGLTAAFQYRGGVLTGAMMLVSSLISIRASMAGIRRINDTFAEAEDL